MRLPTVALAAALLVGAVGCGSSTTSSSASGSASSSAGAALDGHIQVLAAASLTEAFRDAETTLERSHPGFSASFSFAGSQELVRNVEAQAPGDVIATADLQTMQQLVSAGLVDSPKRFARNTLEIVVATGNPKGVHSLADLGRSDLTVVLEDKSVPAGKYSRQALDKAGVTVHPRSLELSVKAELQKVESGDADAGIVYVTDVASDTAKVDGVSIPSAQNVVAEYPVAVLRSTHQRAAAQAYVDEVVSGVVQAALRKRGFASP